MSSGTFRIMLIACLAVFGAGVVSAATYEEDQAVVEQAGDDVSTDASTTSTAESDTDTVPDTVTSTTVAGTTETTVAPTASASPTTGAPTATTTPGRQLGTTPGTYRYDVTGTVDGEDFSGVSTLVVSPVGADGTQTHTQTGDDGDSTTTYRHTTEGTYLLSLRMAGPQGDFELSATSPFLIIPADAGKGTRTTGTLAGEGLTAKVTFTVLEYGTETSTASLLVDLSGKVSGIPVEGEVESTIVARTSDQLPLDTRAETDITAGGGLVSSTASTRSVLRP